MKNYLIYYTEQWAVAGAVILSLFPAEVLHVVGWIV